MKSQAILILGLTVLVLASFGCQKGEEEAALTSISIVAESTEPAAGQNVSLTVTGLYSDDTVSAVDVDWTSGDSAVARVVPSSSDGATGTLETLAAGTVEIIATARDGSEVSDTIEITVLDPVLVGLVVSPATASVPVGGSHAFRAIGTFSDGSTRAVDVEWATDDVSTATVDQSGEASGVAAGTALIEATSVDRPDLWASASLTVTDAVPVSLTVSPDQASVVAGLTTTFTATVRMSDGSTETLEVTWSSDDSSTATVDAGGTASGVAPGTANITAVAVSDSNLTDSATLTVEAPVLASLTIQPNPASVDLGQTVGFSATGHYTDGSSAGEAVIWSSDDVSTATVDTTGTATGVAPGTANITATAVSDGSITATAALTVKPPFDFLYLNDAYHTSGTGILRVPYAGGQSQVFSTARTFYTNGLCLSPDRSKMYLLDRYGHIDEIDMTTRTLRRVYNNQTYNVGQSFVSLTADAQGNLYTFLCNNGTVVYKIDPNMGTRTTFCAINGQTALFDAVFYQGDIYVSFWGGIAKGSAGGSLQTIYFGGVMSSIDIDAQGNFYSVDTWTKKVYRMKDTDNNGYILGNEAVLYADFSTSGIFGISECIVDSLGQVYVAEIPGGTPAPQGIWRLNDTNQDGDCLDAGEMNLWSSAVLGAACGGGNMAMK